MHSARSVACRGESVERMLSVIFDNASVVDGTGRAPFRADVGIAGERIALIGNLREQDATTRVDCSGKTLAPGFIDVHSHSDELWLALPQCDGKIAQGVTTEIGGNCGMSAAPLRGPGLERVQRAAAHVGLDVRWRNFAEFFDLVERNGTALNVASLVGLGTTRHAVTGDSERSLQPDEMNAQAALVRAACEEGAIGISSGLAYPPSSYADMDELVAMAAAARDAGSARYASHIRNEDDLLLEATHEALEVGRKAGVLVQCSHHKAAGKRNWGKVTRSLALISDARAHDVDAYADVYPYEASWTELATILPPESRYGGIEATITRLRDPQISDDVARYLEQTRGDEWHDVLITEVSSSANASLAGMRLDEIAAIWNEEPARAAIRLLIEERLDVSAAYFRMCEDDVATVLSSTFCCVGSDASVRALTGPTARGVPHPRTFGTFPRVLQRFVRERGTLNLVEAIARMTALPAKIFGFANRGSILENNYADLVLFDETRIADMSTYARPYAFPLGIAGVYVNGEAVVRDGVLTGKRPGKVLRGH